MKKVLLSMALVAMSAMSMMASSFKVEINGQEVNDGDVVEITELKESALFPGLMVMHPELVLTNLTSNNIDGEVVAEYLEIAQPGLDGGGVGQVFQFCFNSCYMIPSEVNEPITGACTFGPNEVRTGNGAHVEYVPAFKGDMYFFATEFYYGVTVLKVTLRDSKNVSDAITFTFKFNYADPAGVEGLEVENATAEYYNFQGVKVAQPTNGEMYIVRRGNKVTKEIVR